MINTLYFLKPPLLQFQAPRLRDNFSALRDKYPTTSSFAHRCLNEEVSNPILDTKYNRNTEQ